MFSGRVAVDTLQVQRHHVLWRVVGGVTRSQVTLLKSMGAALRSVVAVVVLLLGSVYVFSVIFRITWVDCKGRRR